MRSGAHGFASSAAVAVILAVPAVSDAQMDRGPKVEKTYGSGLPREGDRLIFADDQYPVWPLMPDQERYAGIDGARMKRQVVDLAQIALRYRDAGHKWWGRFPGTTADRESMTYMTRAFEALGLEVEHFPYVMPDDWRPTDWAASYKTAAGATIPLATAFPVSGTRATGPQGLTAEAVWVGIGAGADFIGRDVRGKCRAARGGLPAQGRPGSSRRDRATDQVEWGRPAVEGSERAFKKQPYVGKAAHRAHRQGAAEDPREDPRNGGPGWLRGAGGRGRGVSGDGPDALAGRGAVHPDALDSC